MEILISAIGLNVCAIAYLYEKYKEKYLEYMKVNDEEMRKTSEAAMNLECAKEKTKQELEKTKQLEIKKECLEKYNQHIY